MSVSAGNAAVPHIALVPVYLPMLETFVRGKPRSMKAVGLAPDQTPQTKVLAA